MPRARIESRSGQRQGASAAGSVLGAVLASSCCIAPLVLISLGASGAWIGRLTALKPYQPLFVAMTVGFLGYGFWQVYGRARAVCDGDACATRRSGPVVKTALWSATVLVLLSLTTDAWAPWFY
ncbi:MAG: mercury transporter MerT [Woeseia sp.]|nr:mercury transporter MerT [Woeseia sp.]